MTKNRNSIKDLFNWSNWLGILFSTGLWAFVLLFYSSYSDTCRGLTELKCPLVEGEPIPWCFIDSTNSCSLGDASILWIWIFFVIMIFTISQIINHKNWKLTVWNFIIMLLLFWIIIWILSCFLYGELSIMM